MRLSRFAQASLLAALTCASCIGYQTYRTWPVYTKDCSTSPTENCLHEAVTRFNYEKHTTKDQYYYFASYLIQAGHYQQGIQLLRPSESPLNSVEVSRWAAQQVAEEALAHPDQVASFDVLRTFEDPSTPAGAILKSEKNTSTAPEALFDLALASYLEGGEGADGEFNGRAIVRNFHPTATWNHLIRAARESALQRAEPSRSTHLIALASRLRRVGYLDQGLALLQLAVPNAENAAHYADELEALGRPSEAATVRAQYSPPIQNLISVAEHEIKSNPGHAESALKEAFNELLRKPVIYNPLNNRKVIDNLLHVSRLFYQAGGSEDALDAIQKAIDRKDAFIPETKFSEAYRYIGQLAKAKAVMAPFADPSTDSCSPYTEPEAKAREFYALGMPEIAARKIAAICGRPVVFGSQFGFRAASVDPHKMQIAAWLGIYLDAVMAGKDVSEVVRYAGPEVVVSAAPYLASSYLDDGDERNGEGYLAKAINESGYRDGVNCDWGHLAQSANRYDLVEVHFRRALEMISRNLKGLERQTAYISLAACHNQIRMWRIVASLPPLTAVEQPGR